MTHDPTWRADGDDGEASLLAQLASDLCRIDQHVGIGRTLAIGELLLTRLYDGKARERGAQRVKASSIRRLASRRDCPLSKSALHEAVNVYIALHALPHLWDLHHVTASHVASVLPLPQQQREALLLTAEASRLSVRELRELVIAQRQMRGTRAAAVARRSLCQAERALMQLSDSDAREPRSQDELRALRTLAERIAGRLSSLSTRRS